ncbi:MAG: class I SAM-dependent methyltransferase [Nanoarchaeota archaeon]|nr:class I SAM-dependent methyltransferase [Nanoarchaeota archaeon]
MERYPQSKRNPDERALEKTEEDRKIAREFGKEFFDGDRKHGYGGYSYHPRFWTDVVQDIIKHYKLTEESSLLDVGCGKGFMLYDFKKALPGMKIRGIDISRYAVENGKEEIKEFLNVGNAKYLGEFKDKEFDLVISTTTIHNLPREECKQAVREIQRVGKNAFVTVDAWRNEEERKRMEAWNLTALTYMHVDDWKKFFEECGYTGDCYWFTP